MADSTSPSADTNTSENMEKTVLTILSEVYPSLDCGPGTPMYEMVVRPISLLWERQSEGIDELLENTSFQGYAVKDTEVLDRLMNRYFLSRRLGKYVTGVVRIIYTSKADVYIAAGEIVEASNDRYYEIVSDHYVSADELQGDEVNGYYIDVAVQSLGVGSTYNASANDAVTVTGDAATGVSRAYFISNSTNGGNTESNYVFYNRGKNELTNRGLYSYKGVKGLIFDNFSEYTSVTPIGLRDDEMIRDLVNVRGYGVVHIGGKCDIYVRPNTFTVKTGYTAPLGFPMSYGGYTLAENPTELMTAWNSAEFTPADISLRGSMDEDIPLLTPASNMSNLTCDLSSLSAFINNSDNNLLHTDNLVKQQWPIVFTATITVSDVDSESAVATVKTAISDYVNTLPSGDYPQIAEIAHVIRAAGVMLVHMPIEIKCYYLTEHLRIESIGLDQYRRPVNSLLIPLEDDSLKFRIDDRSQISLKTCCWYTNEDLINVEVAG